MLEEANPLTGGEWGCDHAAHAKEVSKPLSIARRTTGNRERDILIGLVRPSEHFTYVTNGSAWNERPDASLDAYKGHIARQHRLRSPERNPISGQGLGDEDHFLHVVSGSDLHVQLRDSEGSHRLGKGHNHEMHARVQSSSLRVEEGLMVGRGGVDLSLHSAGGPPTPIMRRGKVDDPKLYAMVERRLQQARERTELSLLGETAQQAAASPGGPAVGDGNHYREGRDNSLASAKQAVARQDALSLGFGTAGVSSPRGSAHEVNDNPDVIVGGVVGRRRQQLLHELAADPGHESVDL
jgi:hypothetical protein